MVAKKRIALAGVALIAVAVVVLWTSRTRIADDAIRHEFAARGVPASYVVREIGFRTQRLERIVIGDPARPDLTAEWAEVELVPGWSGVSVRGIRAGGVRLRGRYDGTRTSWGTVDKLLPPASGQPFALPAIAATLTDARIAVATPYGPVGVQIDGAGRLDSGFRGRAIMASSGIGQDGCRAEGVRGFFDLRTASGAVALDGPVGAKSLTCAGIALQQVAGTVATPDAVSFSQAKTDLTADIVTTQGVTLRRVVWGGRLRRRGSDLGAAGTVGIGNVDTRSVSIPVVRALEGAGGSPVGPIAAQLAQAVRALGRGVGGSMRVNADRRGGTLSWALSDVDFRAASGAQLTGDIASAPTPTANLRLAGGGFPSTALRLSRAGTGWRGSAEIAPMAAGSSRIALSPVALAIAANGAVEASSVVQLDGTVGDGRIEGLRVPLSLTRDASGNIDALPGCTPVAYRRLVISGAVFAPSTIRLCPVQGDTLIASRGGRLSGGARMGAVRLNGRSGDAPFSLAAASLQFALDGSLRASNVAARLGQGSEVTRLDIARVEGRGGLAGVFAGLSGQIGKVPLIADRGQGRWRFANGTLDVSGALTVSDAAATARFVPLIADGVSLRMKDGRVTASATLREPTTRRAVTAVDIAHDLSRGTGQATLRVESLSFGKVLQPDMITPLTKGVVQLVQGIVDGTGTVRWTRDAVTSSGRFSSDNLDFAAAFGPVVGARGTVEFDDLLAMSTKPGQRITLASVNPGVDVTGGEIFYRLRPNQVVEIERGRWPFAGGELLLEPATLDFGNEGSRRLVFRVVGLDAGKFIERLQLQDIAATGIFDGALPVVFGANEGRVEGGRIVARGGGTLSYVGDVSNAQTNTLTRLAFDALKSIRYQNLAIELDGALDGEIVSRILFTGTNQAPVKPSGLVRSFTGLPFKFNIVVRAPFRGLVNTARSLQDPALLVQPTDSATGAETKRR